MATATIRSAALELANSASTDYRGTARNEDRLLSEEWLDSFLARWGFGAAHPPGPATAADLASLRSLLRHLAEKVVAGSPLPRDRLAELNHVLEGGPARRRVVQTGGSFDLVWQPSHHDWNWVLAEIAASFAELLTRDPRRLKLCANPDCRWVFYDSSKNRSRRWCENTCASLVKVRRFRARRRTHDG
ncbi:MAG: CGNR zinc finger domain-containing protein [bacterium]|nr:CGNR zinc finger domain-containing protein [bacterium]